MRNVKVHEPSTLWTKTPLIETHKLLRKLYINIVDEILMFELNVQIDDR